MNRVYLVMHEHKENPKELFRETVSVMNSAGIAITAEPWLQQLEASQGMDIRYSDRSDDCDAVLSLGGDGTLLRASRIAGGIPLLGVNVGRVGFLAEMEFDRMHEAALRLARGDYRIDERSTLQAKVNGSSCSALNDIVISRGETARLIRIEAYVGDECVARCLADGMIVSSPTGSTGYSLSAGGPIVCPEVECMLLTPICAHTLQQRPIIMSGGIPVKIRVECGEPARLSADGQPVVSLENGNEVNIGMGKEKVRLIRMNGAGFFERIQSKLSEWSS